MYIKNVDSTALLQNCVSHIPLACPFLASEDANPITVSPPVAPCVGQDTGVLLGLVMEVRRPGRLRAAGRQRQ